MVGGGEILSPGVKKRTRGVGGKIEKHFSRSTKSKTSEEGECNNVHPLKSV